MDRPRPSARRLAAACVAATAAAVAVVIGAGAPAGANFASPADAAFDVYTHHPLWRGAGAPRRQPALVKYYGVKLEASRPGRRYTRSSRYLPGGSRFRLASDTYPNPALPGDAAWTYDGWDLLRLPYYGLDVSDWAEVALHRDARLCLALGERVDPRLRLPGYERAGVAVLPAGAGVAIGGETQASKVGLFCKDVRAGVVTLPRATRMGIAAPFAYDIILGEKGGGRPVRQPPPPGVRDIYPNTRCPDGLHDLWRTGVYDWSDKDSSWKTWRTWHPQVDPIYWCYYGHDHGTAPHFQSVMPRFGYTAWKNRRQFESHIGFKGYGFSSGPDDYYITAHVDTTAVRRVRERFHTVTLAATSRKTGETMADLSCKGDFGFTFALAANFRTNPTNILTVGGRSQQRLYNEVAKTPFQQRPKNAKRVNVWSGGPDTDRDVDLTDLPRGRYEVWDGGLGFCATSDNNRGMTVDVKDSLTACATRACPVWAPLTRLAPVVDVSKGVFTPNRALRRDALFDAVVLSRDRCGLRGDSGRESVFYTDPYCKVLRSGPGPNSVRQVLKPGWQGYVGGKYASVESWYGMYQQVAGNDEDGGFENIELGVSEWN